MEAEIYFGSEYTIAGDNPSLARRHSPKLDKDLQPPRTRILLVDDDDNVRNVVKAMLEDADYYVYSAESGVKAISFFRDNLDLIDLLVSDVMMPIMNGREMYEQLSGLRPGLPVVFISGYSSDILKEIQTTDNVKFLAKPLSQSTLVKTIQDVLQ
ncbi:MAG: response regulator [Pedobacter sp.]